MAKKHNTLNSGNIQQLSIAPCRFHAWVEAEIMALFASRPNGYSRFGKFEANTMFGVFDRAALNDLTRKHTGFTSFHSLVIAKNFTPSFNLETAHGEEYIEFSVIYQAYNIAQRARGDERRAHVWRG